MKRLIFALLLTSTGFSQTTNFAITSGYYPSSATEIGLYSPVYYKSEYSNNVASTFNGGLQPVIQGQIENAIAGTTTVFGSLNPYDPLPTNAFAGIPFSIVCHNSAVTCTGGAVGQSGTIASNTAGVYGATATITSGSNVITSVSSTAGIGNYAPLAGYNSAGAPFFPNGTYVTSFTANSITLNNSAQYSQTGATISYGPTFTFSSALSSSIVAGDVMKVHSVVTSPVSTSCATLGWNQSGTGTCSIDTTDIPPAPVTGLAAPVQAVKVTNTSGQTYTFQNYFDSSLQLNYYFVGQYAGVIQAKLLSGTVNFCPILQRLISGGNYMGSCATLTGTGWQNYSVLSSAANEGAATSSACPSGCAALIGFQVTGTGSAAFFGFKMVRQTHTTSGTWDDRVIGALQAGGWKGLRMNLLGAGGALPVLQSLQPEGYRPPSNASQLSGNDPYGSSQVSVGEGIDDHFKNALVMGTNVVIWEITPSASDADLVCLSDYIGGGTGTPCGAIRIALGQTAPWTSVFSKIILPYDNESWNNVQPGYYIAPGGGGVNTIPMTVAVCQKLKANASWNSAVMKCSANTQQAQGGGNASFITSATNGNLIDTQTSSVYHQVGASDCTQPNLTKASYVEAWANTHDSSLAQYQTGASSVITTNYEAGNGTSSGNCTTAQIVGFPEGEAYGLTDTATPAYLQRGFPGHYPDYAFWELDQLNRPFSSTASTNPATSIAEWGAYPASGGSGLRARPTVYAQAAYNAVAGLGSGRSVTVTNPLTYNFTANNAIPSESNVPYLDAFAFCSGGGTSCTGPARGIAVYNFDTAASHPFTLSGLDAPSGTVTKTLFTSTNVTDNNESSSVVTNSTSSQSGFTLDTLPAHSIAVYQWSTGAGVTYGLF